ncbi:MAG: Uma2 family endonuclease [Chloroflexia bacterium]|nr:Uma2 family endonuclease [Chloroflexia bacterium]MDQ3412328.1 Uma2 family endonuclease [Chloroflexota bacterium]
MSVPTKLMTYDELLELPDLGDHYELIDGVLIVPPASSWMHADMIAALLRILFAHVPARQPGKVLTAPVDVRLSSVRVLQPDIVYISPERRHLLTTNRAISGAPDLVAEVLSPSNRRHDLDVKFAIYEQVGVREYWIVNLERERLTMFVLHEGRFVERPHEGGIARSTVLPGLDVDISALFANLF